MLKGKFLYVFTWHNNLSIYYLPIFRVAAIITDITQFYNTIIFELYKRKLLKI